MREFMNYDFNITEIITACYVGTGKGRHKHTDRASHGLALHLFGDKEYHFSDCRVVRVGENDVIYLPKGSSYFVKTNIPGECYAINFQISEDIGFSPFAVNVKSASELLAYFKSAKRHWDYKRVGYQMRCKADLYRVICNLQDEHSRSYVPKSKYKIIEPAVEYINENFTRELLSISKLSEMCNVTPEYFRKIFREFFGDSPVVYINKMKISRAKELISSGMYSISEACELSGYNDLSHFSREFKKATGVSPSEYC